MHKEQFQVDVTDGDAKAFAELSGDWNPLHTDTAYAAATSYERPILHGAFSAGLVSRMAGMYLPGRSCLLHGMKLRFIAPILPPATLTVFGSEVSDGHVDVTISDTDSGQRYVEASYEFGHHEYAKELPAAPPVKSEAAVGIEGKILVTGAQGGLGREVLAGLGEKGLGVSRTVAEGCLHVPNLEEISEMSGLGPISGIVHCAWPQPDGAPLLELADAAFSIDRQIAQPLRQILALARLLKNQGSEGAAIILVGSTFAQPGRHMWRMPLYSLSKSLLPTMSEILTFELAAQEIRCINVVFDILDGGMNKNLNPVLRQMHADRTPAGKLPTLREGAEQIIWVLGNRSMMTSGATINLTGSAIP